MDFSSVFPIWRHVFFDLQKNRFSCKGCNAASLNLGLLRKVLSPSASSSSVRPQVSYDCIQLGLGNKKTNPKSITACWLLRQVSFSMDAFSIFWILSESCPEGTSCIGLSAFTIPTPNCNSSVVPGSRAMHCVAEP